MNDSIKKEFWKKQNNKPRAVRGRRKYARSEKGRIASRRGALKYYNKVRGLVFDYYGRKCVSCGISDSDVLTIDHIDGGGGKHSREIGKCLYSWLVGQSFPEGFQVLCYNCNIKKYKEFLRNGRKLPGNL